MYQEEEIPAFEPDMSREALQFMATGTKNGRRVTIQYESLSGDFYCESDPDLEVELNSYFLRQFTLPDDSRPQLGSLIWAQCVARELFFDDEPEFVFDGRVPGDEEGETAR